MLPINPNKFPASACNEPARVAFPPPEVSPLKESVLKIATAGACGTLEMSSLHPVDTAAKRLMVHKSRLNSVDAFTDAVFGEASKSSFRKRVGGLYPGANVATGYTVCSRAYKFGTQPILKGVLEEKCGSQFRTRFDRSNAEIMLNGAAGSLCGVGEVVFLPLDTIKVKSQLQCDDLKKKSLSRVFLEAGPAKLYRGVGWAVARNAPGSFVLFGLNTAVQSFMRREDLETTPTLLQEAAGSVAGVAGSTLITNPVDVVKTRLQATPLGEETTGVKIAAFLLRNEGASAFLKGIGPRLLLTGPKVALTMTLVQHLHQQLDPQTEKERLS